MKDKNNIEKVDEPKESQQKSEVKYCQCISLIGIDGEEFGKWTCRSCGGEVFNKHRQY